MRDLAGGPRRFVELQRVLPGISTEQLRSRLNRMVADGLLTRQRYREVPPRVDYELTERARALMPVLGELARWGYAWAWGRPRREEAIDVGAILRVAPGLLSPPARLRGSVACVVTDRSKDRATRHYVLTAANGSVEITEGAGGDAPASDATVSGPESSWIEAFAPGGDLRHLDVRGDRALAERLLGDLAAGEQRATAAA